MDYLNPIVYNERGPAVKRAQQVLAGANRFGHNFHPGTPDGVWGRASEAAADAARWWLGYPLAQCATGKYGAVLHAFLTHEKLPSEYALRHVARRGESWLQHPPLPGRVHFPNALYPPTPYAHGLQAWIAPQAIALARHFNLSITAGWGGHPPHAAYSDHAWGGAVDLAGAMHDMVKATFWADNYCSGFYRRGMLFRWVGGPAHDASGIEPGHYNHCHISWYRLGPATSIFNTPEFAHYR